MADVMRYDTITIPALGRPFRLGSLYDCRNETLLTGESLWGPATLKKFSTQNIHNSESRVEASTDYYNRAKSLDVSGSMNLSFLANLIEVSGSAEYLNDWHSESMHERVTVKCHTMSHSDTLTMDHLDKENIEYPELITRGTATHVVTGIQYGGDAYLIFDRKISDFNESSTVQGEMEFAIATRLHQDIREERTEDVVRNMDFISYTFHGDCKQPNIPMNFKDAIQMCKDLPKYLEESGGRPQVISLLPLTVFNPQASQVQEAMTDTEVKVFVRKVVKLMNVEKKCENLLSIAKNHGLFRSIIRELESFLNELKVHIFSLREDLNDELPKVRNGEDETQLLEIISEHEKAPFSIDNLEKWLDEREKVIKLLIQYLEVLPDIKVCQTENDFDLLINNPKIETVYCLMIERPNLRESLRAWKENRPQPILEGTSPNPHKRPAVQVIQDFSEFIKNNIMEGNGFGAFEKRTGTKCLQASVKKFQNGRCINSDFNMNTGNGNWPEQCTLL